MLDRRQPNQTIQKKTDQKTPVFPTLSKPVVFGSAMLSGLLEVIFFHAFDTAAKRIQFSKEKLFYIGQSFPGFTHQLNGIVFQETYNKSLSNKFVSLYNGAMYAGMYKALQQTYRFGGQPMAAEYLNDHYGNWFKQKFGEKAGKILIEASSGSFVAVGETLFLPLDNIKTKYQNQRSYYHQQGIWNLVKNERWHLYSGTGVTLLRNIPGTFSLFGVSAFVKEHAFHLQNPRDATLKQNFIAAAAGSSTTVILTNFADVVKTRVQTSTGKVSTLNVFKEILKKEGFSAFFKGTGVKLLTVSPKLTFAMTASQSFPAILNRFFNRKEVQASDERKEDCTHKMPKPR